jgi:hypothetical protein
MLNRLRRNRDPWPPMASGTAPALQRGIEPGGVPADDYMVEGDRTYQPPSVGGRVVHGLQILLIVILAVLSFAVFWLIGLMFNIF